jgi:UDP-glucose 4-epimerase
VGLDVLVTGGCGYTRSALVPELLEAADIDQMTVLDSLDAGSPQSILRTGLGTTDRLQFRRATPASTATSSARCVGWTP